MEAIKNEFYSDKRYKSAEKESFPSMYDTSSAGHIQAGDEPLESAQRELFEELGIKANEGDLTYAGKFHIKYAMAFHGRMFRDLEKDESKIEEPLSIDSITSAPDMPEHTDSDFGEIYGLPKNVIDRYNEICEYQAQFGFEQKYVELALYLNEKRGIELQDAFKTVEDLIMDFRDIKAAPTLEFMIDVIEEEVPVAYIKHLYPDVGLWELKAWSSYMKVEGGNILEETPEFVRTFFDNISKGLSYKKLKELYKEYQEKYADRIDFMKYVELVQADDSIDEYIEFKKEVKKLQEEFDEFLSSIGD